MLTVTPRVLDFLAIGGASESELELALVRHEGELLRLVRLDLEGDDAHELGLAAANLLELLIDREHADVLENGLRVGLLAVPVGAAHRREDVHPRSRRHEAGHAHDGVDLDRYGPPIRLDDGFESPGAVLRQDAGLADHLSGCEGAADHSTLDLARIRERAFREVRRRPLDVVQMLGLECHGHGEISLGDDDFRRLDLLLGEGRRAANRASAARERPHRDRRLPPVQRVEGVVCSSCSCVLQVSRCLRFS